MNAYDIVETLRRHRARKGQAQNEVASRVGIGARNLRRYEYGEQLPRLDTLVAWCEELGMVLEIRPAR